MRRNINNVTYNKTYLLSKVSQELIFSYYTNIPIDIIKNCIETEEFISSPFRIDKHPSVGFKYNNKGSLKMKDFAGYFHGDCFDAAAYVLSFVYKKQIDINVKHGFIFVLKHMYYVFKDYIYGNKKCLISSEYINKAINNISKSKNIIEFSIRNWNNKDSNYWNKGELNINYLNTRFVYPVEEYWINKKINPESKYYYNTNTDDPCYAYVLGQDKNNIYNIQLYFPNRLKHQIKFITNCNHIHGVLHGNLINYDYIIITKSSKDRLCLSKHIYDFPLYGVSNLDKLNILVINLPAENYYIKDSEYEWIKSKSNKVITLFDNDKTGKKATIYYRDNYNTIPLLIPKQYKSKDFFQLKSMYNNNIIQELITTTKNYIINTYDKEYKFIRIT